MKGIAKVAAIIGFAFAYTELIATSGEVQALTAMKMKFPDEIDQFMNAAANPEEYGITKPYTKLKLKTISALVKRM